MQAFGIDQDVIDAEVEREKRQSGCEVHADNEATVLAFLHLKTQWRIIAGLGKPVYQGLEYAAIPPVLDLLHIPRKARNEVFAGLRVMEQAALDVLNLPVAAPDGRA